MSKHYDYNPICEDLILELILKYCDYAVLLNLNKVCVIMNEKIGYIKKTENFKVMKINFMNKKWKEMNNIYDKLENELKVQIKYDTKKFYKDSRLPLKHQYVHISNKTRDEQIKLKKMKNKMDKLKLIIDQEKDILISNHNIKLFFELLRNKKNDKIIDIIDYKNILFFSYNVSDLDPNIFVIRIYYTIECKEYFNCVITLYYNVEIDKIKYKKLDNVNKFLLISKNKIERCSYRMENEKKNYLVSYLSYPDYICPREENIFRLGKNIYDILNDI